LSEDPTLYKLPFRGGTLEVWSDTKPGQLAVIAQLSLEDPRLDAFYKAAGVILKDPSGRVVFPDGPKPKDRTEAPPEADSRAGAGDQLATEPALEPESGDSPVPVEEGASPPSEGDGDDLFGDLFG
jgi:hypothetical protein